MFSNGNILYSFRNPKYIIPSFAHEYIKLTLRYQLPNLLNNYIINTEITNGYITEVNDIGNILTNVERIPLTVCKRIVKSLLISEYSYICNITDCYVCNCNNS